MHVCASGECGLAALDCTIYLPTSAFQELAVFLTAILSQAASAFPFVSDSSHFSLPVLDGALVVAYSLTTIADCHAPAPDRLGCESVKLNGT